MMKKAPHRRRFLAALLLAALLLPLLALALLWLGLRAPPPLGLPERGARLGDVTIVLPGEGRFEHRSIAIEGGRITAVGPADPGAGGPYAGAFVLPGLNDMHVHWPAPALSAQIELFAFLHLFHGVTAVRSMGDNFAGASLAAKAGIEEGRFPGPRVFSCGPFVDGDPPLWTGSLVARNPAEAREAVARVAAAGFDCVKAYDGLSEESAVALREEAHARGLPAVGHTPRPARFEVVRLDDVQHLRGMHPPFEAGLPPRYPFFLAAWLPAGDDHLDFIVEESLRHGMAHTPTLVTDDRLLGSRDYARMVEAPAYRLLPRWYRDALWDAEHGLSATRFMEPGDFDMVAGAFARKQEAVRRLHAAGVPVHSGSDTMAPGVVPGAGLHRELELLVEAGLTPEQALATSTRSSAAFLGVDGLGEIRPGAPAELVLYREDPTRDLAALSSIAGVVRDGRLHSRAALDAQLERYREHFEGFAHRVVITGAMRLAFGRLLPLLFTGDPEPETN